MYDSASQYGNSDKNDEKVFLNFVLSAAAVWLVAVEIMNFKKTRMFTSCVLFQYRAIIQWHQIVELNLSLRNPNFLLLLVPWNKFEQKILLQTAP